MESTETRDTHQLLLDYLRAAGCTCEAPDITFTGKLRHGEINDASIGHDLDCPLMASEWGEA